MSWFARSIANSFKFDDDDVGGGDEASADQKLKPKRPENPESQSDGDSPSPDSPTRGVKEDLSELSKTLTRQLWGVASFLAPPPQAEQKSDPDVAEPEQGSVLGLRGDFAVIGGKFRSGISRLSNNINVSEITKMASNLLQLESDEENESGKRLSFHSSGEGAIGVTEVVVAFARDIAMHPETWLDFPLPENDRDDADFDMSDAQQEHALAVERLAPSLAALRFELCPRYMSESSFWKVYFVLLHPKLDKDDGVLLSTPQILEARALLTNELKNRRTINSEEMSGKSYSDSEEAASSLRHGEPLSVPSPVSSANHGKTSDLKTSSSTVISTTETGNHTVDINKVQTVHKSVVAEKDFDQGNDQHLNLGNAEEDDTDDWLKEETSEVGGTVGNTIPIENEEDVSFSDLEEDDGDLPASYRKSNDSSDKDSRDWVQLGKSSIDSSRDIYMKHSDGENANDHDSKESNDWLDIDDIVVT